MLYTGTFEAYQGLDLLFAAMALVSGRRPDARLLLAGGKPDQVRRAQEQAQAAGIGDVTLFAGERPASEIPAYLLAADVLVSPRSRGTNTPLKIYQYLRSGKAIVATRLLTHTQVLDDDTAILTGVSAAEFADGILAALENPGRAAAVGRRARELAETKYSYEAYLERTRTGLRRAGPIRGAGGAGQGRQGRRVKDEATRDHYSYTVYADPATARTFDDRRFGGPIGELIAAEQARVLIGFIGEIRDRRVLDVGSGTGRAALLLARAGARVTGVDASEQMLAVARQRAADEQSDHHVCGWRRPRARVRRSRVRRGRQLPRADAHAAVAGRVSASCAGSPTASW